MVNIKKNLLQCILVGLIGGSIFLYTPRTHAINDLYDCGLASGNTQILDLATRKGKDTSLYNQTTIKTALEHLQNYCANISTINTGKPALPGAESPYLLDHLIDLGFRKLDSAPNANLRYNLSVDTTGAIRQRKIATYNDTTKTISPETIIQDFQQFWGNIPTQQPQLDNDCVTTNYNTLNLYKRYIAVCEMAKCLSKDMTVKASDTTSESSASLADRTSCSEVVEIRFMRESVAINQLISRVNTRIVKKYVDSYTNIYFTDRRSELFEQFSAVDQGITFVNRKVQEGTRSCNK